MLTRCKIDGIEEVFTYFARVLQLQRSPTRWLTLTADAKRRLSVSTLSDMFLREILRISTPAIYAPTRRCVTDLISYMQYQVTLHAS